MLYKLSLGLVIIGCMFSCSNTQKEEPVERLNQVNKPSETVAKNLLTYIKKQSENGFLVGHQDAVAYGVGWKAQGFTSDVYKVSGKYPAVFGWDLGHIHDTMNIDSVPFYKMKNWAIEVNKRGGINTYGWHALNFNTGESSWDDTPCVADILPGGEKNHELVSSLNKVADFFNDLVDENGNKIPVVFRPWHEMNGAWFWWGSGSCTTDEYKELYRFTVDYLRETKGLEQLLYCYSPDVYETREEFLEFYPGDDYVDILGVDDYKGIKSSATISKTINRLEILADLADEKNKLFVFSETGLEQIPNSNWFTEVLLPAVWANEKTQKLAWVLLWRNYDKAHHYVPYPDHPAADDFRTFANHEATMFLDDLNN